MTGKNGAIKLVAGNSNPALAEAIGKYIGSPMTKAVVRRFADMEIFVEIQENVRGADVFVLEEAELAGRAFARLARARLAHVVQQRPQAPDRVALGAVDDVQGVLVDVVLVEAVLRAADAL